MWIHSSLFWLSCSTDGVIVENDIIKAALEIKSYTSQKNFRKAFKKTNEGFEMRKIMQRIWTSAINSRNH